MGRVTYGSAKQPNIPVPMGSFQGVSWMFRKIFRVAQGQALAKGGSP